MDVNAICDAGGDVALSKAIAEDAAVNVKRVQRHAIRRLLFGPRTGPRLHRAFVEIKTTWHPIGL